MTYTSVISRKTVHIALPIVTLNGLEVKCGDVFNAHITVSYTEKIWAALGPEFGADAGKTASIVLALYDLKPSSAEF